jgi:hypothetical protein
MRNDPVLRQSILAMKSRKGIIPYSYGLYGLYLLLKKNVLKVTRKSKLFSIYHEWTSQLKQCPFLYLRFDPVGYLLASRQPAKRGHVYPFCTLLSSPIFNTSTWVDFSVPHPLPPHRESVSQTAISAKKKPDCIVRPVCWDGLAAIVAIDPGQLLQRAGRHR